MNVRTKDVTAFDGQVTFCLLPYPTAQSQIVFGDISVAFPRIPDFIHEQKLLEDIAKSAGIDPDALDAKVDLTLREQYALGFAHMYGSTFDILFNLKVGSPAELENFRAWWLDIGQNRDDTVAALAKWMRIYHADVAQAWDDAINETRQPIPQAAPELRPDAAQLAEGDANFPNDESESSALSSGESERT